MSARTLATFLAMLPAVGTAVFLVDRFFRTSLGLAMRATGDNAQMARSMGIDDAMVFIAGLAVSNGLVGLSGALFAQYQGFVTIQMSIGNAGNGPRGGGDRRGTAAGPLDERAHRRAW